MDWSGGDGGFTDIVSRFHKGREIFLCHCEQILCHWETDLAPLAPVQGLWLVEFSNLFSKMTGRPGQTRPLTWTNKALSWEKICKLIFFQVLVGIWWHWVSIRRYWLVLDCTWSVEGSNGCYLVVLHQYRVVLVGTWWYWIKTGRY